MAAMPWAISQLDADGVGEANYAHVDTPALRNTLGAVLLGSLLCMFLSGIVFAQTILYYRMYPTDRLRVKFVVAAVWFFDIVHSAMACAAVWVYLIENFGVTSISDYVTWTVAVTVAFTAIVTFLVHIFFTHRILTLSRRNWWVAGPVGILAFSRLVVASVSTGEMIRVGSFSRFVVGYKGVFTTGMSLGAALDVIIASILCLYLRRGRTGLYSMDRIIDSLTLYTIENGLLTCATTVVSLVCWLIMPYNLIFLGLHFAITKLYANSFLATLNARKVIISRSQGSTDRGELPMPLLFPENSNRRDFFTTRGETVDPARTKLQITVQKTVKHEALSDPSSEASAQEFESGGLQDDGDDIKVSPHTPE